MHTPTAINSFVQRTWRLGGDPALNYKMNGVPIADMPNDVSLAIGNREGSHVDANTRYSRQAVLTGSPMSKFGASRAGVFMDEHEIKTEQKIIR